MGLFDRPTLVKAAPGETRNAQLAAATTASKAKLRNPETLALARQAVRESMVLLKNKNKVMETLKNVPDNKIMVTGRFANNIGWQLGGWTRVWQGESWTNATTLEGSGTVQNPQYVGLHGFYAGETLLEAMEIAKPDGDFSNLSNADGGGSQFNITGARNPDDTNNYDVVLVTVGETNYAEGTGDTNLTGTVLGTIVSHTLQLHPTDYATLQNAKANYPGAKIIMVCYSSRPLVLDNIYDDLDAFVQVWWPGTEGLGMTDVLFGDYDFTGKTGFPWYWHPEWLGFNDDPNKPYMFNAGSGLKKSEEFNAETPIPVKPSGDIRQGSAIAVRPVGTTDIDGRIYTWNARQAHPINEPNFNSEPFKPTYYQPVYDKSGLMASTQIILPTAANWCGDTWVEYKINVVRAGSYNVNFARTGNTNGTVDGAVTVLIDGVQKASYTTANMTTTQAVDLTTGEHILRLAFTNGAAGMTVSRISLAAPGTLPSFTTNVDTIVAIHAANIGISDATDATRAEMQIGDKVVASTNLVNGAAILSLSAADVVLGDCFIAVYNGNEFVSSKDISIVPLPDNIWTMSVESVSNMIMANFNATISLVDARFSVTLAGKSVGGTLQGDEKSILFADVNVSNNEEGDIAVITGVKFPNLFPSYSFTFTGALQKK